MLSSCYIFLISLLVIIRKTMFGEGKGNDREYGGKGRRQEKREGGGYVTNTQNASLLL